MLGPITPFIPLLFLVTMVLAFPSFSKQRGALAVVLLGTLFLPQIGSGDSGGNADLKTIKIGIISLDKATTINLTLLIILFLYDSPLLFSSPPGFVDLPMIFWCISCFISIMANDPPPDGSLQIRDALVQLFGRFIIWTPSYMAARLYFTKPDHIRELALAFILSALVYFPLCVWEIRMSPNLHYRLYGFAQSDFGMTIRYGGYRPMVFFPHGISLGFWMVSATMLAAWLAFTWVKDPQKKRIRLSLFFLIPTSILIKSTGALALGLFGFITLYFMKIQPSRLWILTLVSIPILYVTLRSSGSWNGEDALAITNDVVGEDRTGSLEFRFKNENILIDKAFEKPIFGWGGWGRNRVFDEKTGNDVSVTDGYWIIVLGLNGFFGLIALGAILLLPAIRFAYLFPPQRWCEDALAPATGCLIILILFSMDSLFNAFPNGFISMMAGSVIGLNPKFYLSPKQVAAQSKTLPKGAWGISNSPYRPVNHTH